MAARIRFSVEGKVFAGLLFCVIFTAALRAGYPANIRGMCFVVFFDFSVKLLKFLFFFGKIFATFAIPPLFKRV